MRSIKVAYRSMIYEDLKRDDIKQGTMPSSNCMKQALYSSWPPPKEGYKRIWIHPDGRLPYWYYEKQPGIDEIYQGNNALQRKMDALNPHSGERYPKNRFDFVWDSFYETWVPKKNAGTEYTYEELVERNGFYRAVQSEDRYKSTIMRNIEKQEKSRLDFMKASLGGGAGR